MDLTVLGVLGVLVAALIVIHERQEKSKVRKREATLRGMSPEEIRTVRLAREAEERQAAEQRFAQARAQTSSLFQILGIVLILLGIWLLLVDPGAESSSGLYGATSSVVSLQKLFIGATASVAGVALLATGVLLKFLAAGKSPS
jgi:uncharacterized membrane protein